ncbi:hypothetical protein ACQKWADRAFT_299126 [Trichoderma austrokoningii]
MSQLPVSRLHTRNWIAPREITFFDILPFFLSICQFLSIIFFSRSRFTFNCLSVILGTGCILIAVADWVVTERRTRC